MMKQCSKCKQIKITRSFQKDRTTPDGLDYQCKVCNSDEAKKLWASKKGKASQRLRSRKYELKRNYGISLDEYDALLAKQNGVCAICDGTVKSKFGNLHVDHDHKTGKIRGLLCIQCNVSLGMLKEHPERINRILSYIEHNVPQNTQQSKPVQPL